MNILIKKKYLFLNIIFFSLIFFQISLGRTFSGIGSGIFRITTILHIFAFVFYLSYLLILLKNNELFSNKIYIIQSLVFIYLLIYFLIYLNEIENFTNVIQTFRHTTIFFVGIWYLIGRKIFKYLNVDRYLNLFIFATLVQFFSFNIYEYFNTDIFFKYSDKGDQIYNASDLGTYFLIFSLLIYLKNKNIYSNKFIVLSYIFLLPAILNASRGAFLAYLISGIYFFYLTKEKIKVDLFIIFGLILVLLLGLIFIPSSEEDKFDEKTITNILLNPILKEDRNDFINLNNPDLNISYRFDVWNSILDYSLSNGPKTLFLGEYYTKTHPAQIEVNEIYKNPDPLIPEYPHNFIIFLLGKFGLFGLALFLYLLFSIYKDIDINKRKLLFSLVLFLLIDGSFDPVFCDPYTSLIVFLNIGILSKLKT